MASDWAKVKFFYDTMLGADDSMLQASSTESSGDYDVEYLYNWLETNGWKAAGTTVPQYITFDGGSGTTMEADYLIICGHNMAEIGAIVTLQYSSDDFSADVNDAFTGEAVTSDGVYLKEFTNPGAYRYWRLKISGTLSAAPYIALSVWGEEMELDYCTSSFDPYEEYIKANVGISYGGYLTGSHLRHSERRMSLSFSDSDDLLYQKVKVWRESHGLNNLFVAWETAGSPADVWLMRPSSKFRNPFNETGLYRDISIELSGRKE